MDLLACRFAPWVLGMLCFSWFDARVSSAWIIPSHQTSRTKRSFLLMSDKSTNENSATSPSALLSDAATGESTSANEIFREFVDLLQRKQDEIIHVLEDMDGSGQTFCNDTWGIFSDDNNTTTASSGGKTRVIQGGNVVEKGACSFTLIQQGVLTGDRAAAIRSRQQADDSVQVKAGDTYSAGALSIVLHSKSPMIPTFRSDVRIFLVSSSDDDDGERQAVAWFGGGADLTPYYLFEEDISEFHKRYSDLCAEQSSALQRLGFSYASMKEACDKYFFLPARSEHRGTGGIFFDDMEADASTLHFLEGVVDAWMPSWLSIVHRRRKERYSDQQREWQLLRRGRYLEFNLLYDRGVKFGLATANPRVEGVMVSAPPLIAWEYNHEVKVGSQEAALMDVLKKPREWANQELEV